jgi:hypothetical protein
MDNTSLTTTVQKRSVVLAPVTTIFAVHYPHIRVSKCGIIFLPSFHVQHQMRKGVTKCRNFVVQTQIVLKIMIPGSKRYSIGLVQGENDRLGRVPEAGLYRAMIVAEVTFGSSFANKLKSQVHLLFHSYWPL